VRPALPREDAAADEALSFLAELACALHAAYLPADVVEARILAAARGLGIEMETFTLQSLVLVQRSGRGAHLRRTEFSPHWNLARLHALVALSDAIAEGARPLPAAQAELARITAEPPLYSKPLVVLAYAVYGAAVAARVGGGVLELLAAGVVGIVAGFIHHATHTSWTVELQKSFLASFLGALAAFALALVLPPFDAAPAIFGAMTLLVPAIVVTLGAEELASEAAVEAGVARLAYGAVRFVMLGAGALAAANLWSFLGPAPGTATAAPLPTAAVAALLAVGGVALVACLQARPRDTPWIVAAVLLAWAVQELTKGWFGGRGGPFLTSFVLSVAALLYGRLHGKNPATVLFPGLLQIAPGFLGTRAVLGALRPGAAVSADTFFDVLVVAVQLALGMLVASAVIPRRDAARGAAG
jgi:uncharacterized membrane protein YjjP (DUF1212 family)